LEEDLVVGNTNETVGVAIAVVEVVVAGIAVAEGRVVDTAAEEQVEAEAGVLVEERIAVEAAAAEGSVAVVEEAGGTSLDSVVLAAGTAWAAVVEQTLVLELVHRSRSSHSGLLKARQSEDSTSDWCD